MIYGYAFRFLFHHCLANEIPIDAKATLDRVIRENVVVVAECGCERLLQLAVQRKEELESNEAELEILQTDLRKLERQQKALK